MRIQRNVRVPMRDGVELAADFYCPAASGPFPTLLERTPYNREESVLIRTGTPKFLASRGYLVVIQDVRGRFGSDGIWYPFIADGWGELRDGYDTVEWLARHPLSNGRIGTLGGSFAGQTQMQLAPTRPPHLKCAFVREAASDLANQWVYRGGAFELGFNIEWNLRHGLAGVYKQFGMLREALARRPDLYAESPWLRHEVLADPIAWLRDCLAHPDKDEFYAPFDQEPQYSQIDIPIYHLGGWFDIFLGGTIANFIGIQRSGRTARARRGGRLVIGPWTHGSMTHDPAFARYAGEMDLGPEAVLELNNEMLRWFDYGLCGLGDNPADSSPVRYFLMGENRWHTAQAWPPPQAKPLRLYLGQGTGRSERSLNGGRLLREKLTGKRPPDDYLYDPHDPVPSIGGNTLYSTSNTKDRSGVEVPDFAATAGPRDQCSIEARCLTYSSEPLREPLVVVGPIRVILYASCTAPDTDLVAKLCDVFPDGRSILVADGILRARYRLGRSRSQLLTPRKIYEFDIDLWSTAWLFPPGHQLRVAITSSCFPRFDCNPNTGRTMVESGDVRIAHIRVYHDAGHPSHILLSVIPGMERDESA